MAAVPVHLVADTNIPDVHGPVPDTFTTAIRRSWMMPGPVKTTEPTPGEVACLVEKSFTWSDHDRAQECVRICHKHPFLWQEFLFQEKVEKKRRERNSKRLREALASETSRDEFTHAAKKDKQRFGDRFVRHLALNS